MPHLLSKMHVCEVRWDLWNGKASGHTVPCDGAKGVTWGLERWLSPFPFTKQITFSPSTIKYYIDICFNCLPIGQTHALKEKHCDFYPSLYLSDCYPTMDVQHSQYSTPSYSTSDLYLQFLCISSRRLNQTISESQKSV